MTHRPNAMTRRTQ